MKMDRRHVRDAILVYLSFGYPKSQIADKAGVSRPWLDSFLEDPEGRSAAKVDDLREWLRDRAQAASAERRAAAAFLRWTAQMLEDTDLPLPLGLSGEGDLPVPGKERPPTSVHESAPAEDQEDREAE